MTSIFNDNARVLAITEYSSPESCFNALVSAIATLESWYYDLDEIVMNSYYLKNDIETRVLTIEKVREDETNN